MFLFLGAKISTCVAGQDCLTKCGGDITCMIPVTDMKGDKICTTNDIILMTNAVTCKGFADQTPKPWCPTVYTDISCACCKYGFYTKPPTCNFQCRCYGICSFFKAIGFSIKYIFLCQDCEDSQVFTTQGSGFSTKSIDTTELARSSTPPNNDYPIASPPPPTPPPDCSDCSDLDYYNAHVDKCKCQCACNYITSCAGTDAPEINWYRCWTDYAFCCECAEPNNYALPCPGICDLDSTSPLGSLYGTPVTGKTQTTAINCTFT
jgi:hypothetical protein